MTSLFLATITHSEGNGRVTEVYPGSDNKVRNVKVKTANGTYDRPITKLAVIHAADE